MKMMNITDNFHTPQRLLVFQQNLIFNNLMKIIKTSKSLAWGQLDLPLFGLSKEWTGSLVSPPAMFSLACDREYLWFIAMREEPAEIHPSALPGNFTTELWKYDCAELFISNPANGEYIEFNLAPNSAWWACKFASRRTACSDQPNFTNNITTWHDYHDSPWLAAMAVRLDFLQNVIAFGTDSEANVTFILGGSEQIFVSAAKLPGDSPDFHQPIHFEPLHISDINTLESNA